MKLKSMIAVAVVALASQAASATTLSFADTASGVYTKALTFASAAGSVEGFFFEGDTANITGVWLDQLAFSQTALGWALTKVNYSGTQHVFTVAGTGDFNALVKYTTTISPTVPTNAPVASVPEPESYAMFLAGLGIMGAIARRRSSRA